jgi:hypothetical protein
MQHENRRFRRDSLGIAVKLFVQHHVPNENNLGGWKRLNDLNEARMHGDDGTQGVGGCQFSPRYSPQSTQSTRRKRGECVGIAVRGLLGINFMNDGDKSCCCLKLCVLRVLRGEQFRLTKRVAKSERIFRLCD